MTLDPTEPISQPDPNSPPRQSKRPSRYRVVAILVLAGFAGWYLFLRDPSAATKLQTGREAIELRDWITVERSIQRLHDSGKIDAAILLEAELMFSRQDYDAVIVTLNRLTPDCEYTLDAAQLQANAFMRRRPQPDLAKAYGLFEYVIAKRPDSVEAHRALAAISYDLGQLTRTLAHLKEVNRLAPDDGRPYRLAGLIHFDLAAYPDAITEYVAALKLSLPGRFQFEVSNELAQCYLKMRRYTDALETIHSAEKLPQNAGSVPADWRAYKVEALYGVGATDDAQSEVEKALQEFPESPELHLIAGKLALAANRPDDAVRHLETAQRIKPAEYDVTLQLVQAYTALGETTKANQMQQRATEQERLLKSVSQLTQEALSRPWDVEVRLKLSDVSEQMGRPELARMWRQAADACRSR